MNLARYYAEFILKESRPNPDPGQPNDTITRLQLLAGSEESEKDSIERLMSLLGYMPIPTDESDPS